MSLLSPTRGELLDRLSIVCRRIVEIGLTGGNIIRPIDESNQIIERLVPGDATDREKYSAAAILAATNAALWERENLIRKADCGSGSPVPRGPRW